MTESALEELVARNAITEVLYRQQHDSLPGLDVSARQVDEPGAGNGLGHVAAVFWVRDAVVRAIQDQRGSPGSQGARPGCSRPPLA
jgi:hypothetical protein